MIYARVLCVSSPCVLCGEKKYHKGHKGKKHKAHKGN